jgi:hypothetical protein
MYLISAPLLRIRLSGRLAAAAHHVAPVGVEHRVQGISARDDVVAAALAAALL